MDPKIDPKTVGVIITAVVEVLARIIPTVKDYTIVGRFIKWINKVSEYLNVKKQ